MFEDALQLDAITQPNKAEQHETATQPEEAGRLEVVALTGSAAQRGATPQLEAVAQFKGEVAAEPTVAVLLEDDAPV